MRTKLKYKQMWVASVDIEAMPGFDFMDLIEYDCDKESLPKYVGAWANIIVQSSSINQAFDFIKIGLGEKNMKIKFIDKIENLYSLVEYDEVKEDLIKEAEWLYSSPYKFLISDKLWPYVDD